MRIFVMFGTQDKRFDRLLNAILNSNFVNENEVYVQRGYTKGDYSGINGQEYYTEDELNHQIEIFLYQFAFLYILHHHYLYIFLKHHVILSVTQNNLDIESLYSFLLL